MKFLLSCIALSSTMAFAQNFPGTDRCTIGEIERTFAQSRAMCDEKLSLFASQYPGIKCDVTRYHLSVCWANCYNSTGGLFAKARVDMTAFCESEHVSYRRTKITFY
ncbi:hypothetical protein [Peredibacter starrii]|uniref:Secreted protein n=1 Tax=Peredibacter starrii TaxID=28202 RepID=A0AAX4HLX7_9BACT|nr:hypothetical protein [Peredibacter starrii]WPU64200.1 hypothetical protein SOO65_16010 [Peredibacter starrii]